ncbi:MAG: DciA family protein [Flavobacteriaceae bacterium]
MSKAQDEDGGREAARAGALRLLGAIVPSIVGAAAKRHGIAASDLVAAWPQIVGEDWAARCRPVKISSGSAPGRQQAGAKRGRILVVAARRSEAVDIEYAADTIITRVNSYLGPGAIGRISVEPTLLSEPASTPERPAPAPIAPDMTGLSRITETPLREALGRMQGAIKAENSR